MTKIKLCGLKRRCDIDYVNELLPDYIGFVFAKKSKRYVTKEEAKKLRKRLHRDIVPVGVFVNEEISNIEYLVNQGIIEVVQLHGKEEDSYVEMLKKTVKCPIIQAFGIEKEEDIQRAITSKADYIMLDSGGGMGKTFDHSYIKDIERDFFLAGGLDSQNVKKAILQYRPYAVDASSSLETRGVKDREKMAAFVKAVRNGKDEEK